MGMLCLATQDYVVEKWDEVSVSEEFEVCCQEVAGGECVAISSKIYVFCQLTLCADGDQKAARP